jgi:peptidoglycan hydrolase CwlO-like protein
MPRKRSTKSSTKTVTAAATKSVEVEAAPLPTVEEKVETYDHSKLEKQIADLQKEVKDLVKKVSALESEKVDLKAKLEESVTELREGVRSAALNVAEKADDRLDSLIETLNSDRRFKIKFDVIRAARKARAKNK